MAYETKSKKRKLSDLSNEELKYKMEEREKFVQNSNKWLYKDRRHKALLNEYERRVMRN